MACVRFIEAAQVMNAVRSLDGSGSSGDPVRI
jgi:hypothetical protein